MDKQKALEILCITSNASMEEIKSAYRKRAKKFHPDRFNHESLLRTKAESKMKDVNLAFQILYNPADQKIDADSGTDAGSYSNKNKSGKSNKSLYEKLGEPKRFFMCCYEAIWANPDPPHGGYIKPEKSQGRCSNWSISAKASIFFSEIFKKIERGAPVQNKKTKAKIKQYKGRMGKNNYVRHTECRFSDKKKKLKSFDSMLRKNLKTDIIFPVIKNKSIHKSQRINMRSKFFNTRVCRMQRIKRKKYFMDSESGPVQKITPISPVKKIT